MPTDDPRIDDLVSAVAEGRTVDWSRLLDACTDENDRRLIAHLRVLSQVARSSDPVPSPAVSFRWGPLDVLEELGHGAFGHVFRARDPRLDREVALKLFERSAIGDGELVREAQMLARVHHPHVVVVHGADEIDGRVGIWMELVRGRTLHDVMRTEGPFGPREATLIGIDLCRALATVHAARLLHRDVKSANVMREIGGRIVLMDFGAGIHREVEDGGGGQATGTPFYMAPELLEGSEASVATDLYALGVLLFHLMTGTYPVGASSIADLREQHRQQIKTRLREARPEAPPAIAHVVDRALAASPTARYRSAAEMERALAASLDVERAAPIAAMPWWRRWAAWPGGAKFAALALPVLIGAVAFATGRLFGLQANAGRSSPDATAFTIGPPEGWDFARGLAPAVSPDGTRIAFATATKQTTSSLPDRLWMRRLDSLDPEPIPNTDGGNSPFWSPDSKSVAFTTRDTRLQRVDVAGGSVVTLADWGLGGTWNADGDVLFSGRDGRIYRVSQDGGPASAVTTFDTTRGETRHLWPFFLPDGRKFLFMAQSAPAEHVLYVGSLDSALRTRIASVTSKAEYSSGFLYYQREGTLVARPFELNTARFVGDARPVATAIRRSGEGGAGFSVSGNGVLVYTPATAAVEIHQLAWFDAKGKRLAAVVEPGNYGYPSLSPDGSRLAVSRLTPERLWDLWTVDLVRNVSSRFTFSNEVDFWPTVWSPDGRHLFYSAQGDSRKVFQLYRRSLSGASKDEPLFESEDDKEPTAISPDGRLLLFNRERGRGHGTDTWALPLADASHAAYPVLDGPSNEESAVFSPDGRWIAYASN